MFTAYSNISPSKYLIVGIKIILCKTGSMLGKRLSSNFPDFTFLSRGMKICPVLLRIQKFVKWVAPYRISEKIRDVLNDFQCWKWKNTHISDFVTYQVLRLGDNFWSILNINHIGSLFSRKCLAFCQSIS